MDRQRAYRSIANPIANSYANAPAARLKDSVNAREANFRIDLCRMPRARRQGRERAPNIAENPKVQKLSDAQIFGIIQNGIPGTGMPAFHSMEGSAIKAVVSYLHILQGTDRGAKQTIKLPGDPERGEAIFFGKAGCSGCHMVGGKGGFIASDLSAYARTYDVEQIRSAIR